MVEKKLSGLLVAGYITELVAYDEIIFLKPVLQGMQGPGRPTFLDLGYQMRDGGEHHAHALHTCLYA